MNVKHFILLVVFLFFCHLQSRSQVSFSYSALACGVPTTNVTASIVCAVDTPESVGINADDIYSTYIPIGFTFSFYGNSYTQLVIGANGNISFRDSLAGAYNPWSITGSLAGSTIRNSICGPWCDMNFPENGGSCTFQRKGTAPNRRFIVSYCRVSMYSIPYCAGQWITSQVILYETSNIAEVHMAHKTVCTSWNNGRAICGVINASGSASTIAPSRDWSPNWSATNEAWRFTPAGAGSYSVAPIAYAPSFCGTSVYWYDSVSGAYLGTGPSVNISTSIPRHVKAAVFSNCRDTSFYYVTVPVPTVNPNPKEILGQDSFCVGAMVTYTDSTPGGTWGWSGNVSGTVTPTGINVTGVSEGAGLILYILPTGCSVRKFVAVKASPSPISPSPISICRGRTDTCSNLATSGRWSSGSPAIATIGSVSGIITGVSIGTGFITYTMPLGCFAVAPVTVNPQPSVLVPADTVLCQGKTAVFSNLVSGGSWSSSTPSVAAMGTGSGIVSAVSPGTATIMYMLPAGCFSTANITVNSSPGNITPSPASVCMNSTLVLSDVDFGGSWSSGNTAIATIGLGSGIASPVSPGATLISYTFTNGCYRTVSLSVNPLPAPITPPGIAVCTGSTGVLSDASAGGTWSSADISKATVGSLSGSVTGVAPGITTISYTLSTGCFRTATVTINDAPAAITPPDGVVCQGDLLFLSDSTAGGTWSSANTAVATVASGSGIVTAVSPGTAIVSYILPGVCYRTDTVTVRALPTAVTPANMVICQGGTDTFMVSPPGGDWSSGNPAIAAMGTSGIVTALAPGTTTITYSLATGCFRTAQIYVEPASAIFPSNAVICTGKTVTFTNTGTGGTWSISDPSIASISTGVFTVSATAISPGTTTLTYSFPGGCYRIASITVNPSPADITGTLKVCTRDTTVLTDTSGGGTGLWSSSTPAYATVSAAGAVAGRSGGTATITYKIANGCIATAVVTVFALPDAGVITGSDTVCLGNAVQLLKNEPGTPGFWYSGNTAILTINGTTGVVNGLAAGTAMVTYKTVADSNGCVNYATFRVHLLSEAPYTIMETLNAAKCFGDDDGSILVNIVNGSGSYTYKWQDGTDAPVLTSLSAGDYSVTVMDTKTSCSKTKDFTITQPDSLDMTFEVSPDICSHGVGAISVAITGGTMPYAYHWSNDSTGAAISGLTAGNYDLTVTDINSCHKLYTIPVRDSSGRLHVHDALSPNGDGYNDVWLIDLIQDNPFNQVQVFNKWGNILWEKSGYNNDWDGIGANGEKLPDGTYYYVIRLNNPDPKCAESAYKGALLIKR